MNFMNWGAENHELRFDGIPQPELPEREISGELDIQEECMRLKQQIEDNCVWQPEYIWRIDQLSEHYSICELELLLSKCEAEVLSAKNKLLFATNGNQDDALTRLCQAMMASIMVRIALGRNKEES